MESETEQERSPPAVTAHEEAAAAGGRHAMNRVARAALSRRGRLIVLLGMPAFGLALASTVVSTYLPVFIEEQSGPAVTGLLIGGEGLVGLFLPALVGPASDGVHTRFGARIPFVLAATALAVLALVLMALAGSILGIAIALLAFYVAYFVYYTPYRALYPDLVPEDMRGRAVGIQGGWRSAGLLLAMGSGGVLLGLWRPLPFLLAAAVLAAITFALFLGVVEESRRQGTASPPRQLHVAGAWRLLAQRADIRSFIVANSLWELTVYALRAFGVLFFTVGLGRSLEFASIMFASIGVAAVLAAPISGWAADRFGYRRVIEAALWVFGIGLLGPLLTLSPWVFPLIPLVAFAAVVIMTLPYSVLMRLMPDEHHGAAAGLFDFSHGVGTLLGPLLAGAAIELLEPVFPSTKGYLALFLVASAAIVASIPFLRRAERQAAARDGRGALA